MSEADPRIDPQPAALTQAELGLYSRQLLLPEIAVAGQTALKRARVLVVGAGGLGSPVLRYLAAAGIGTLGIVEFDVVDASNLHRQILFDHGDIGRSKAQVAAAHIAAANPLVQVEVHETRLSIDNAASIVERYDVIVDATDNFAARYLISDVCVAAGKSNVSASILRFEAQLTVFRPGDGPCYRCLFPEPPPPELAPSCAEAGVLGVLPGVVGCLQATEVLKLVLGTGDLLVGRLLTYDALTMRFRELSLDKDPDCPACGDVAGPRPQGLPTVRPAPLPEIEEIEAERLMAELERGGIRLIDVRTPAEHEIARIEGATLIPLFELDERLAELPSDAQFVAYCHKGARSRTAASILMRNGFPRVRSLRGGIDAWSRDVNSAVPRY